MLAIFRKKWVWIVAIFLIINILGLLKIISLIETKQGYQKPPGVFAFINKKVRSIFWPIKKSYQAYRQDTKVEKEFKVESVTPRATYIYIDLSKSADIDKLKGYVAITPKTDFYLESKYSAIYVNGDFKPGDLYEVEVLKGMPSIDGDVLKESFTTNVVIPDYNPSVKFKAAGMYMSLEGNQIIPVEVINIDKLEIKVHRVYANNVVYLLNNMTSRSFPDDLGIDVIEEEIITETEWNEKKEVLIDLREILADDSHGLFFMRVSDTKEYSYKRDNKLILTTDIGILAKQSESDLFVWLNSISTTSPTAGATVKVFSKTNQQILEGVSDENGFMHFKDVDWSEERKPFVITASTDSDLSFIELEKCSISETVFDIEGRPYLSSGYEGFIYSDRGVYRPGETVHLRTVIRGQGVEVPDSFPVLFDIKKPDGMRFDKVTGILSEFGTVDIDLPMPDYALTGAYEVSLKLPGDDEAIGTYSFNVEEFMPDRIKVDVNIPEKRYKTEEIIPVKVKAEQFFGAPASNRLVEVKYFLRPVDFTVKKFNDYSFSDSTKEFSRKTIQHGFKDTDDQGEADFEVTISKGTQPPSALNVVITTAVKELGGRAVAAYSKVAVDPYSHYIGIRKTNEGYAGEGEQVQFGYVVVSPQGEEVSVGELDVQVCKIIWNSVLKKDKNGRYRYVSDEKEECIYKNTIKTEQANGKFTFTPDSYGSYIVRIKGKEEGAHTASAKFYCSGYGYMPWAMERPDRIELELDKKIYNSGDEATLLVKAPFKGKALLAISKDRVLFTKIIDLENATQEILIPIREDFAPNAYCSLTVIKPVIPEEKWSAHRAYGIIPIMLDNSQHKLKVNVNNPESMLPNKTVVLDIEVTGAEGLPQPSELSIALVDEGVLRLTGFETPDPFEFFFGKRGQKIETSDIYSLLMPEFGKKKIGGDSTPSADKAFDPKKHLNPISAKRVKPVVLWKSGIVTDEQGKAGVTFDIPQFSGNLKVMVVSAGTDDFGNATSDIKVSEPLMIKPTFPRFLSSEDEFIVPASVFNTSGKDGTANISVETSGGLVVTDQKTFSVEVKNNSESFVSFSVKAPELPQKGKIKISASMAGHSTFNEVEIPVRPAAPFTTISGAGSIKAPGSKNISIPGDWLKGTEQYSLSVMSLPGIKLAGGIGFLIKYPYGCIEQTTSTVFPLLYLKDMTKFVESKSWDNRSVESYIDAGIRRILSMQAYSGGFSFWPGYKDPYPYGSVYATDFLVEADKAGYSVPQLEKDIALDYLEKILSGKEEDYSPELKVYSCMVLAKAGRIKASWIRRLQEIKDKLPVYSRYRLAVALAYLGDDKGVSEMLGKGFPDEKIKQETGASLNSYTKQNAVALSAYMDVAPDSEMVPVLAKRLESSMENGRWKTTQDNAMALLALGKYARYIESQDKEYSGSVSLGENIIANFTDQKPAVVKDVDLSGKDMAISVQGKGNVYYYWNASGVPLRNKIEESDAGIKVRRRFLTRDGKPLDVNKITQGEVIIVELSVDSDLNYKNVVVADLLPACFEIENPRLKTRVGASLTKGKRFEPDHVDIRDDRFLMFTDMPGSNKFSYQYVVRAVTKGDFTLPPVSAECMYDPSIKSVSGQGRVQVE